MNGLQALMARLSPAAAERAASDYLTFLLTGKKAEGAHPAVDDIATLPMNDRTLDNVLAALNAGRTHPALPAWAKEQLANMVEPALQVIAREYPAPTHRAIVKLIAATDYRPQNLVTGLDGLTLGEVGENGVYPKSLDFEGDRVTTSLRTFGRIVRITRQTITNDASCQYFRDVGMALLAAAYRLEARELFALLEANGNLADGDPWFTDGNNVTSPSVLGALVKGFETFAEQRFDSGEYVATMPAVLVVPPSWYVNAADLPSDLALNRDLLILKIPHVTHGYLVANPSACPAIGLLSLSATATPQLETNREPTANLDIGLEVKVRHDFAVVPLNRAGIVRLTVA